MHTYMYNILYVYIYIYIKEKSKSIAIIYIYIYTYYILYMYFFCIYIYDISKICHKNPVQSCRFDAKAASFRSSQCYYQRLTGLEVSEVNSTTRPPSTFVWEASLSVDDSQAPKKQRRSVSYPWYLAFVNLNQKIGGKFTFTIILQDRLYVFC